MMRIPKIPAIPTEYVEAIGFVVLLIAFAVIVAGGIAHVLEHSQSESETEALREDVQDIIDMINRRDNYYGE